MPEALSEFIQTAQAFVDSFVHRDKAAFLRFLKPGVPLTVMLPTKDGAAVHKTYDSYAKSQDHWFNGTTGSFAYEVERADLQTDTLGFLVVRAHYKNTDARVLFHKELIITFGFKKIDNTWIKVYSQNTVVKETR